MARPSHKFTSHTSQSTLQTQEQRILGALCKALPSDEAVKKMLQTRLLQWTGLIHRSGLLQSVLFAERKSEDKGWKAAFKTVQTVLEELGDGPLSAEALHRLDLIEYQRLQLLTLEVTALGTRYLDAQLALKEVKQ
ncbi:MAG: hypothetical protein IPK80_30235 [Nannocystis sp.]|nr:hypothetical protein [Nannocystis sp.]